MLIYLISFLEALANGLVMVNTTLFLKFNLGLAETKTASVLSTLGIVGSLLIFVLGPLVDKIGVKKAMAIGALSLAIGRIALGYTHSFPIAMAILIGMAIGSAIKGSSVLIALRSQNGSFKLDYVIFNIGYCIAGLMFDVIHDYSKSFIVAGIITLFNLMAVLVRKNTREVSKNSSVTKYDVKTLKIVTLYNAIMIPVMGIFTFMASFIPKWAIAAMGPDAPVGKLYESLNPAIIMVMVPIFAYLSKRYKLNPYTSAIIGTLISSISMFFILVPGGWLIAAIITISVFTVGEAIWSPANMEVGTKLSPPGEEGKYLTISLIPRTFVGMFMSYAIAYSFNHHIYVPNPQHAIPFISMGTFALLTPMSLILFRSKLLNNMNV